MAAVCDGAGVARFRRDKRGGVHIVVHMVAARGFAVPDRGGNDLRAGHQKQRRLFKTVPEAHFLQRCQRHRKRRKTHRKNRRSGVPLRHRLRPNGASEVDCKAKQRKFTYLYDVVRVCVKHPSCRAVGGLHIPEIRPEGHRYVRRIRGACGERRLYGDLRHLFQARRENEQKRSQRTGTDACGCAAPQIKLRRNSFRRPSRGGGFWKQLCRRKGQRGFSGGALRQRQPADKSRFSGRFGA